MPGGTTPGPVFDVLSEQALDWDRVAVVLNDERWVPEDQPAVEHGAAAQTSIGVKGFRGDVDPALRAMPERPRSGSTSCREGLAPHLPISVLLLGMGADMHTASLFPGADNLAAALTDDAPPLMAMRAEAAGEPRVTLTAPVLTRRDEPRIS